MKVMQISADLYDLYVRAVFLILAKCRGKTSVKHVREQMQVFLLSAVP